MVYERELIYEIIKTYGSDVAEPKKLCSSIQDYAEDYSDRTSSVNKTGVLAVVVPRFSVSLVYQNVKDSLLRVIIIDADNENEALGKALNHFDGEVKGMGLMMKTIIQINEA